MNSFIVSARAGWPVAARDACLCMNGAACAAAVCKRGAMNEVLNKAPVIRGCKWGESNGFDKFWMGFG